MHAQVIESPLGSLTAYWSSFGLSRLAFGGGPGDTDGVSNEPSALARDLELSLARAVAEYFEGGELEFPLGHCDWTGVPEFHRRVLERCVKIRRAATMTYGQLATAVGSPKAARAVGQAMARNRWPLIIPCHRVLGHSGRMTGYSGAGGVDTKRALLDFESGLPLFSHSV